MYTLIDPNKWTSTEQQLFIFECGKQNIGLLLIMKAETNIKAIEAIRDNYPQDFVNILCVIINNIMFVNQYNHSNNQPKELYYK